MKVRDMLIINKFLILLVYASLSILVMSCGRNPISDCQSKGYSKMVNTKGREVTTEEATTLTQLCVDNPLAFDDITPHSSVASQLPSKTELSKSAGLIRMGMSYEEVIALLKKNPDTVVTDAIRRELR